MSQNFNRMQEIAKNIPSITPQKELDGVNNLCKLYVYMKAQNYPVQPKSRTIWFDQAELAEICHCEVKM